MPSTDYEEKRVPVRAMPSAIERRCCWCAGLCGSFFCLL